MFYNTSEFPNLTNSQFLSHTKVQNEKSRISNHQKIWKTDLTATESLSDGL